MIKNQEFQNVFPEPVEQTKVEGAFPRQESSNVIVGNLKYHSHLDEKRPQQCQKQMNL